MEKLAKLFTPIKIRETVLPNRIVLSPLCMYSAKDGVASDWQFAHLSTFARGSTGLIFAEATAVEPRGRITPRCLGIWNDEQAEALRNITSFIKSMNCVPGFQLAHAGRKAATKVPWKGGTPLDENDSKNGEPPWEPIAPSAIPVSNGWQTPRAMDTSDIENVVRAFANGAKRAVEAGFEVIEIHAAHGYLINSFLSPITNKRNDMYGGEIHGRMKFAIDIVQAVRSVIPQSMPLFCRISSVDGTDEGWSLEDSIILASNLKKQGVDVIDCSSGGIEGAPRFRVDDQGKTLKTNLSRGLGFQVPYANKIRKSADIKTMAVGVIVNPHQAEEILINGQADLIAMGRELMYNPFWPLHAAQTLNSDPEFKLWPNQYRWAVNRREKIESYKGIRD